MLDQNLSQVKKRLVEKSWPERICSALPLLLGLATIPAHQVYAHKIEVAEDVGGTMHLEPDDRAIAGTSTQVWFALTRKGGEIMPLAQCNCKLEVRQEPYIAGSPALLQPTLTSVVAEQYKDIPGAEIVFPKVGLYELKINGSPKAGANFKPFNLRYKVTVTAGTNSTLSPPDQKSLSPDPLKNSPPNSQISPQISTNSSQVANRPESIQYLSVAIAGVVGIAAIVGLVWLFKRKGG